MRRCGPMSRSCNRPAGPSPPRGQRRAEPPGWGWQRRLCGGDASGVCWRGGSDEGRGPAVSPGSVGRLAAGVPGPPEAAARQRQRGRPGVDGPGGRPRRQAARGAVRTPWGSVAASRERQRHLRRLPGSTGGPSVARGARLVVRSLHGPTARCPAAGVQESGARGRPSGHGSGRPGAVAPRVRGVWGRKGQVAHAVWFVACPWEVQALDESGTVFFGRPQSSRLQSTLRTRMVPLAGVSCCARTAAEASGARPRCRIP